MKNVVRCDEDAEGERMRDTPNSYNEVRHTRRLSVPCQDVSLP